MFNMLDIYTKHPNEISFKAIGVVRGLGKITQLMKQPFFDDKIKHNFNIYYLNLDRTSNLRAHIQIKMVKGTTNIKRKESPANGSYKLLFTRYEPQYTVKPIFQKSGIFSSLLFDQNFISHYFHCFLEWNPPNQIYCPRYPVPPSLK